MKFFLIGLMGSGKSFWADELSSALKIPAYHLDDEVEKQEGKSISKLFSEEGEEYFRLKESEVLKRFSLLNKFVLSTGGGTPCFYDNMNWMNANGITIWLDEPLAVIAQRLQKEKAHRPLLAKVNDEQLPVFLEQMRNKRKSFYSKAKHHLSEQKLTKENFLKIILDA